MTKENQNRVWFMFVLSVLGFGIGMIVWTVKKTISLPVQESNNFMLKYQMADMHINDILNAKKKFDKNYKIELQNVELMKLDFTEQNINSKRLQIPPVKLVKGDNIFSYHIIKKDGTPILDAKITFLLTRPHTREDDKLQPSISLSQGVYETKAVKIEKAGRYTLQLKVLVDDALGYIETPAYLAK